MAKLMLGTREVTPAIYSGRSNTNNSEDFVSFVVYTTGSLALTPSTINGKVYTDPTVRLDNNYNILVAVVPKNVSFSYSIGGNNFDNGDGTLTLSNDYVLRLVKSSGNPAID